MRRFEGQVAIVTGAASGIGAAAARRLHAEGASLLLGDVDAAKLAALARELDADGGRVLAQPFDVAEPEAFEAAVARCTERFGRLDVLLNNAGIGAYGRAPQLPVEIWRRTLAVDLDSIFYGCRAAIPALQRSGGGAIVNTASISGLGGDAGLGAYNAAKGGVVNYTRTLALDHARDGIRVNAVCPGLIDTPLTKAMSGHAKLMQAYEQCIPLRRPGRAEEVAAAICFLASGEASYITGATLVIDGGLTASAGQPSFTHFFEGLD